MSDDRARGRRGRRAAGVDKPRIERAVREILEAIGEDPDRDGLRARRAADRRHVRGDLRRAPRGPAPPPRDHVRGRSRRDGDGPRHPALQLVRAPPRPVHGHGPRRLHPRTTTAASPGCRSWPGWSTGFAKRPQVQERLTTQIADALVDSPDAARGVRGDRGRAPVHVDARGEEAGSLTVTSAVRGLFKDNPATRAEAMSFIGQPGSRLSRRSPAAVHRRCADTAGTGRGARSYATGEPGRWPRAAVMGVVNVTPDSFSDGGRFLDPDAAVAHGLDAAWPRRRRARRRRRVDPSRRRARRRRRGAPRGSCRSSSACAATAGRAGQRRHHEGRRRPGRARRRRHAS